MSTSEDELIVFNGINGATGTYGLPPMRGEELKAFILQETEPENLNELRKRYSDDTDAVMGLAEGIPPGDLAESGWGVIFPARDFDPQIKEALSPLLAWRKSLAKDLYYEYEGQKGFAVSNSGVPESTTRWVARNGTSPVGPVDPAEMPYYLLIVGSPEQIPYRFQYQLDVKFAVGRIYFDSVEGYENYANSVVKCEKEQVMLTRSAGIFGVLNPDDKSTILSTQSLVEPVIRYLNSSDTTKDWEIDEALRDSANRSRLELMLGGDRTPAFLFTASHGMEFPKGDPRQIPHQGALLCGDWPGPKAWRGKGPIPDRFYFAGDHLASDAKLLGTVAFFFACYGAGTPLHDEFAKQAWKQRLPIAERPFMASLPNEMLAHRNGGALAVIGHVERAWGYSFSWKGVGSQTGVFTSSLERLFAGLPVGHSFEYFNQRYAELSTLLTADIETADFGGEVDPYDLAGKWTANNDARGYIILGDPAVKLSVAPAGTTVAREVIDGKAVVVKPVVSTTSTPDLSSESMSESDSIAVDPEMAFGVRETLGDVREALGRVARQLAEALSAAARDLTTLEVETYTSGDMARVDPRKLGSDPGATLRAVTHIELDGDVTTLIPTRPVTDAFADEPTSEVEIDDPLWTIHKEMVALAQDNKLAFLKSVAEIANTLGGVSR